MIETTGLTPAKTAKPGRQAMNVFPSQASLEARDRQWLEWRRDRITAHLEVARRELRVWQHVHGQAIARAFPSEATDRICATIKRFEADVASCSAELEQLDRALADTRHAQHNISQETR